LARRRCHPGDQSASGKENRSRLLHRWRDEAGKAGHAVSRIAVAFEAGRDGFWLARWLRARDIDAYVIHPTSIPVSREHRRAKTDRLDIGLLKRAFLGWLGGEPGHCSMAAIPTLEEEDAKRPTRDRESLVGDRTRITNRLKAAFTRLGIIAVGTRISACPPLRSERAQLRHQMWRTTFSALD
jgi:transposase